MAHSSHWLEAALFVPAFAVLIVAAVRDLRSRRPVLKGGAENHSTTKD